MVDQNEAPPVMKPVTDADVRAAERTPRPRIEKKDVGTTPPPDPNPKDTTPPAPVTTPASTTEKIPVTELKTGEEKKPDAKPIENGQEKPADKATTPLEKLKEKGKAKKPETFVKAKEPVVEAKPTDIPPQFKPKFDEQQKRITELQAIAEDPDVQIILEAKKSGKDIFAIMKEVEGVNPDTLSKEQLYELDCKHKGLDGEELEDAMNDFRDMKPYQQTAATVAIKEKLKGDSSQKKLNFLSKIKEGSAQTTAQQHAMEASAQKTQDEYTKLSEDYVGKNHYGLIGTPQMAESLKNILQDPNGLIGKNQDGSLNATELFELAHFKLFKEAMFEELKNSAYAEAYEELEKEFGATSGNVTTVRMPQETQSTTSQEKEKKAFDSAQPVR